MLVHHKDPSFTGPVVVATVELSFADGVAQADLDDAQVAAVAAHGFSVADSSDDDPLHVEEPTDDAASKKQPRKTYEIGATVPTADMEKAPPVIG